MAPMDSKALKDKTLSESSSAVVIASCSTKSSATLEASPSCGSSSPTRMIVLSSTASSSSSLSSIKPTGPKHQQQQVKALCILCKRKFPSVEKLLRHEKLSALHKENLAKKEASDAAAAASNEKEEDDGGIMKNTDANANKSVINNEENNMDSKSPSKNDFMEKLEDAEKDVTSTNNLTKDSWSSVTTTMDTSSYPSKTNEGGDKGISATNLESVTSSLSTTPPTEALTKNQRDSWNKLNNLFLGGVDVMAFTSQKDITTTPKKEMKYNNDPFVVPQIQWKCFHCGLSEFTSFIDACNHESSCIVGKANANALSSPLSLSTAAATTTTTTTILSPEKRNITSMTTKSPPPSLPPSISRKNDVMWNDLLRGRKKLSTFNTIVLQSLEIFRATEKDITASPTGRKRSNQILPGRVGFRCIYCRHLPLSDRVSGSRSFPGGIKVMSNSISLFGNGHLFKCNEVPLSILAKLEEAKPLSYMQSVSRDYIGLPLYCDAVGECRGLIDSENGIFYRREIEDVVPDSMPFLLASVRGDINFDQQEGVESGGEEEEKEEDNKLVADGEDSEMDISYNEEHFDDDAKEKARQSLSIEQKKSRIERDALPSDDNIIQTKNSETSKSPTHLLRNDKTNDSKYPDIASSVSHISYLVTEQDRMKTTDLHYILVQQFIPCTLTEKDQEKGQRKKMPVGYPGLMCRHCCKTNWFFTSYSLLQSFSTDKIYKHFVTKCKSCPDEIRGKLEDARLVNRQQRHERLGGKNSIRSFYHMVWDRLMNSANIPGENDAGDSSAVVEVDRRKLFDDHSEYETESSSSLDDDTRGDSSQILSDLSGDDESEDESECGSETDTKAETDDSDDSISGDESLDSRAKSNLLGRSGRETTSEEQKREDLAETFIKLAGVGWVCKRCCSVPEQFRGQGSISLSSSPPSIDFIRRHRACCSGKAVNLKGLVEAVLGMSRSMSGMKIETLVHPEFVAIVRPLTGGNEHLTDMFTKGVRAAALGDSSNLFNDSAPPGFLEPRAVEEDAALHALADFARLGLEGVWFDIVENTHFRDFIHMIAPEYYIPSRNDLMDCW